MDAAIKRIGVISDTHGRLRPEALEALAGANRIIHAGDIGSADVLRRLESIAQVIAVRGNNDSGDWAAAIPETAVTRIGSVRIGIVHNLKELDGGGFGIRCQVIVSGHSHKPSIQEHGGVLYVNPGSAGPRRFSLPVAVAHIVVRGANVQAKIIELRV